jgi:hypothetical protein
VSVLLAVGCGVRAGARAPAVPDALSSFVVWSPVETHEETSLGGAPVDVVRVRAGQIVRLVFGSDDPVEISERFGSGQGAVESWSTRVPADGVLIVRPGALATAVLVRRGTIARAYLGHGSDPGYEWFSLQDRVIDWARGPLPHPFPEVAPRARIDYESFASLDRVLRDAVAASSDHELALSSARAIRVVAGLRAVRALEPPTGYPYFFDSMVVPVAPRPDGTVRDHTAYGVEPNRPLELPVDGPGLLHVWARVDPGGGAALRVFEGNRIRAEARLSSPRSPLTAFDTGALTGTPPELVRRAVVHVPPGHHSYRLESTTHVRVTPMLAEPVLRIGDAGDEREQLDVAQSACKHDVARSLCALSLALLGQDDDAGDPAEAARWNAAFGASPEPARRVAATLARGGPREPALDLGAAATTGDPEALTALGRMATETVDEGARAAWSSALLGGTEWEVAAPSGDGASWSTVSLNAPPAGGACSSEGIAAMPEVGAVAADYAAVPWHGAPVVELLVVAECSDAQPVELSIDGERVVANPSAPLARWHVRVRGAVASVRRLDRGRAHVFALPGKHDGCIPQWESIRAPRIATTRPVLLFGDGAAPGLELWLRAGASLATVEVSSDGRPGADARRVQLVASRAPGFAAYDDRGVLWTRVARTPLPAWAAHGARIEGGPDVAVRAIVRVPRGRKVSAPAREGIRVHADAGAVDEAALVEASRRILDAPKASRGARYLERALLLAAQGALPAALADARAASHLGARGPSGEDPEDVVQRTFHRHAPAIEPLPGAIRAYGIEPDFDAGARRCDRHTESGRKTFDEWWVRLHEASEESDPRRTFDAAVAAGALAAREANPMDPRSSALAARALSGSRWKLLHDVGTPEQRVQRPRLPRHEGPVDTDGELRPRVLTGGRFAPNTYATVTPEHPATAIVAAPHGARAHADIACVARDPAAAEGASCPVEVLVGEEPLQAIVGDDGQGSVELPLEPGSTPVTVRLRDTPGEWVALARLVIDRPIQGASKIADSAWAIAPRMMETRAVVGAEADLVVDVPAAAVLRVDALPEGGAETTLVIETDGRERRLAADGTPSIVPLPHGGRLILKSTGGDASVSVAERVPRQRSAKPVSTIRLSTTTKVESPVPAHESRLALDLEDPSAGWHTQARGSPAPLSPLQSSIGTVVAQVGAVYGTMRQDWVPGRQPDGYAYAGAGYRRRIESLGLWTFAEAFERARQGEPTVGATATLYEDLDSIHVRLSGSGSMEAQRIAGIRSHSVLLRAFAEYSYRAALNFFVLPRIGYDGMYSSVPGRPTSLTLVDDEVYNPYRSRRPTFLFGQALLWYAPRFNEILYMRLRGTYDPRARVLSHAAVRPGAFVAFGDLDFSTYAEAIAYPAADSLAGKAQVDESAAVVASYYAWAGLGSFAIVPGVAALGRVRDAGWQVTLFVDLLASYRRGLRDFSSLELDFPEQLGGSIPWRGATPGGYR